MRPEQSNEQTMQNGLSPNGYRNGAERRRKQEQRNTQEPLRFPGSGKPHVHLTTLYRPNLLKVASLVTTKGPPLVKFKLSLSSVKLS